MKLDFTTVAVGIGLYLLIDHSIQKAATTAGSAAGQSSVSSLLGSFGPILQAITGTAPAPAPATTASTQWIF